MLKIIAEQSIVNNGRAVIQRTCHNSDTNLYEMTREEWVPKISWFHPPLWRIFHWAYDRTVEIKYSATLEDMKVQVGRTNNYIVNSVTSFKKGN